MSAFQNVILFALDCAFPEIAEAREQSLNPFRVRGGEPTCCASFAPTAAPEANGTFYVVPRGWVGFGLRVPARAHAHDIFHSWSRRAIARTVTIH